MIVNADVIKINRRNAWFLAIPVGLILGGLGFVFSPILGLCGLASVFGFYLVFTAKVRRRLKVLAKPFPKQWLAILNSHVAYYKLLSEEDQAHFRQLLQIFLAETRVTGIGMVAEELHRVLVGASAVIPILGFPEWEYNHVTEVLLYPANFNRDYDAGAQDGNILGMVSSAENNSIVLLSAPALVAGFRNPVDKSNVGIHEFAHVIDKTDGAIDGLAGSLPRELFEPWLNLMAKKMNQVGGKPDINPYGRTNQQEFLAVTTEYFFENPKALAHKHPEVYQYLSEIYKQNPVDFFRTQVQDLLTPKKVPRNAPCPCGSGKKFKRCCL